MTTPTDIDLFRLQAKVAALEYLVKALLHLRFGDDSDDAIARASGYAEYIRTKLEARKSAKVDQTAHMIVVQEIGAILDDLVGEMKAERNTGQSGDRL